VQSEEFEKIYRTYFKDVYYYILNLSRDEYIAEDVTAETFLKAIKAIETFRGDAKLKVWLCQIAKNEYFSYLRKNRKIEFKKNIEDFIEKENINNSLEKEVVSKNEFIRINGLINTSLQEPYREVFTLRVYEELNFKEIGEMYGKTANWACVIYHRARKKLQIELEGNQ